MTPMSETPKELKELFNFIDGDRVEITLFGNDGFDRQEKLNGRQYLKKYILDAWNESQLAEQRKEIEKLRTGQALTNESYGKVQSQLFKAEKEIEELKVAEAHWEKQWKIQCDLTGLAESRILEVRRETIERIEERLLSTESMIARIDILEFLLAMKIEVEQPPTKKDKEIEELRKQIEGKWISVADRLPEPPCIINMEQSNRLLFLLIKEVKEWCGEFERKHLVSTHWQPLPQSPEPPKQ